VPALATHSASNGNFGTVAVPNSAPWNNLQTWRVQFRTHGNWNTTGTTQTIFGANDYWLNLYSDGRIGFKSWADGPDCAVTPPVGTDITVMAQRRASAGTSYQEIWAYDDATGKVLSQATCTGTAGTPSIAGATAYVLSLAGGGLAYMRMYSTSVPIGSPPGNTYDGDLADWEFEGNGADQTGHLNLTMNNGSYTTTPSLAPVAIFGAFPDSRTFVVNAAGNGYTAVTANNQSFSVADGASMTCSWSQQSGPGTLTFGSPASCNSTTIGSTTPGTYTVRLTVNDGTAAHADVKYGGVQVDSSGYVVVPSNMQAIAGKLIPWGTSPWPWFDLTERGDADAMSAYQSNPPTGTPLSGTFTVTGGGSVTGVGTHFTTELSNGAGIGVNWPTPDGTNGMFRTTVSSITDDTHMTIDMGLLCNRPGAGSTWTGITGSAINTGDFTFWGNHSDSSPSDWNFYDNVLGLYRLYYRTGIDTYLTQARNLADGWYHLGLDHGYNMCIGQSPKWMGLTGIIARAVEGGKTEYWTGLNYYFTYPIGWNTQFTTGPLTPVQPLEPRDAGFQLRAAALAARSDSDSTRRSAYCSKVANAVQNYWPAAQDGVGRIEEDIYGENQGYGGAADETTGYFGASTWRASIAISAITYAYDVLTDGTCPGHSTAAATALAEITAFGNYAHDYGVGPNWQTWYDEGYQTIVEDPLLSGSFTQAQPQTAGYVAVTAGSPNVVGTGTNFTHIFIGAPCSVSTSWCVAGKVTGTPITQYGITVTNPVLWIGIAGGAFGCNLIQKVATVTSDTALTLTANWPSGCGSGNTQSRGSVAWSGQWEQSTSCAPSITPHCEGPSLDWAHDLPGVWMWLYRKLGTAKYLDWAGHLLGADYGGPGGGPGTPTAAVGPYSSGAHGNFDQSMEPCGIAPCGGWTKLTALMGKSYGMSAGSGDAPNAVATYAIAIADPCNSPILNPASAAAGAGGLSGASFSFNFTTGGCSWTAASGASWITVRSATNGTGTGTIVYDVAANFGTQRAASISVNGASFTVTQDGTTMQPIPNVLTGILISGAAVP
jgi:hypothetical protein